MNVRHAGSLVALVALSLLASTAHAFSVDVDARCDIFGATHAAPPAADSGGVGIAPVSIPLSPVPGLTLRFVSITGLVGCCGTLGYDLGNGPDGGTNASGATDISSVGGISGLIDGSHTMFLVGVFTADSEAVDPAPDRLDFSLGQLGEDFPTVAPALNQTFFIGDGLTGTASGDAQGFAVPPGATQLWLGFADGYIFHGAPSFYDDNLGSLHAEFAVFDGNSAGTAGVHDAAHGFAMRGAIGDPRRGGSHIRFSLPATQPVTVTVYDVTGRRVRELANGMTLAAGNAEVAWDGRDERGAAVRGGVYFAHVRCAAGAGTARLFATP